jgi:hypothetical protein
MPSPSGSGNVGAGCHGVRTFIKGLMNGVIPRDIAKLALAFTEAAIESLQAQTRELARSLN